jgi:hypothetical protein
MSTGIYERRSEAHMSLKVGRSSIVVAILAATGTMAVAAPPASAASFRTTSVFTDWVVSGSLTATKSQQTVSLPEGSTFNGSSELLLESVVEENVGSVVLVNGTLTGSVFVPPFNATVTLPILGTPTPVTMGITFTQAGPAEGIIKPATGCEGSPTEGCLTLTATSKANVGFSVVGILGIKVPLHCETSEPIELPLTETLRLNELVKKGNHFTGTTTIPPINCPGLQGVALGPVLTTALSGPDNPFSIAITPPPE